MAIIIREPEIQDKQRFIDAMQRSESFHRPWVKAPVTSQEFDAYLQKSQLINQKSYLVFYKDQIAGVFNVNEIVHGAFQSGYLGFYAVVDFAGQGYMNAALKQVLNNVFNEMKLHRLEANIQPANSRSIALVSKNGFRYEGFSPRYLKVNDKWCGHERWAITSEDFIVNDKVVLAKDSIDVVPYDPAWPAEAVKEIEKIRAIFPLSNIIDCQHVGSTAIPGMSAKPIIDIQIAVRSLPKMKLIAVPLLQKLGYEFWADNPDLDRLFFVKGMPPYGEKRTHHVHIVESNSKHWCDKLAFRDYLIAHPNVAKEYEELKRKLACQHQYDRERYTDAKSEFVNKVIRHIKEGN